MTDRQQLIFSNDVPAALNALIEECDPAGVWVVTDENVAQHVMPALMAACPALSAERTAIIKAGDDNKDMTNLAHVWKVLSDTGATRGSLIVNVGGGVVTDLGGFAASTFKRGIHFVNIPTTVLGAVDAAVGGKTGINFNGLKNEVGTFCKADTVILSAQFFNTLPLQELLSGLGEMIKHSLISDRELYWRMLKFDITTCSKSEMLQLLRDNVEVKQRIVTEDPYERGIRRALNFGHTTGHAIESLMMQKGTPVPHGYAVAWGLLAELIIAHITLKFPTAELRKIATYIKEHYNDCPITCDDYPALLELMRHDKKNDCATAINFTLLRDIGDLRINCVVSDDDITTALDMLRDGI